MPFPVIKVEDTVRTGLWRSFDSCMTCTVIVVAAHWNTVATHSQSLTAYDQSNSKKRKN
jgi:hypothetical protein